MKALRSAAKERPIIFSGAMVRAILGGRKTQTRRVVKPQFSEYFCPSPCEIYHPAVTDKDGYMEPGEPIFGCYDRNGEDEGCKCPYGAPGDRLWVRETHSIYDNRDGHLPFHKKERGARYLATAKECDLRHTGRWRPAIHMPRWASRITLEVLSVRVERLQEISEEDAQAEGAIDWWLCSARDRLSDSTAKAAFQQLWESINGPESWTKNPWVWVIEFRRVDALNAQRSTLNSEATA